MALIFELFIETDGDKIKNQEIKSYLLSKKTIATKKGNYKIWSTDVEKDIGIAIAVHGLDSTGLQTEKDREDASLVGYEFYRLLKGSPDFRYAVVGLESGEWADGKDISNVDFDGYLPNNGIVIKEKLRPVVKLEYNFERFKPGYLWVPYLGEDKK